MKTYATLAGSISLWLLSASISLGGSYYCSPVFHVPLGRAPDMCHPGYYTTHPNGYRFGPNYNVYPPFPPFQPSLPALAQQGRNPYGHGQPPSYGFRQPPPHGFRQPPPYGSRQPHAMPLPSFQQLQAHQMMQQQKTSPVFPSHPYVRSPRDFFMWHDVVQDRLYQTSLPKIAP